MTKQRYRKKPDQFITAVQLNLKTSGFTYEKWGDVQKCLPGDWLVNNNGNIYTVDQQTFSQTYREIAAGQFVKTAPVWAEQATSSGKIDTKEASTEYQAGYYLVYSDSEGADAYAMPEEEFIRMYELYED